MTKIEEILCANFGIDVQNIEDDEQGLCAMIEYDTHRSYTLPEPLLKGIKQYAEYYAKIAIRNTRYKAIDILGESLDGFDINDLVKDIQNIDNNSVLPEHE